MPAALLLLGGIGAIRNDHALLGGGLLFVGGIVLGNGRRRSDLDSVMAAPEPIVAEVPWQSHAVEAVLAALGDSVVVLDKDDRVIATNAPARELLSLHGGWPPNATLKTLVDWPQLSLALEECRRTSTQQTFEAAREQDTESKRLLVTITVELPHRLAVVVLRDQSRLRQLESHRRDFVANVSHELKTPLAAIQGFVETILDDPEMPQAVQKRFLERVQRQVQRLATLVTDLLTLSRLDEGDLEPAQPCDLVNVAREAIRDLVPFAEQRGVLVRIDLPETPIWIAAEREALRQVVSNLADNAVKYTQKGGNVAVKIAIAGGEAELTVVDTGIGLAEEDQERVFERFYRVDKARSRELGGTGLGLSIVKNTIQGLGGSIGVRSRLGYGSTFWVRLPLVVTAKESYEPPADSE
ncbi:MAG: ATP-binding protein [Planctomycetota bacterium]